MYINILRIWVQRLGVINLNDSNRHLNNNSDVGKSKHPLSIDLFFYQLNLLIKTFLLKTNMINVNIFIFD